MCILGSCSVSPDRKQSQSVADCTEVSVVLGSLQQGVGWEKRVRNECLLSSTLRIVSRGKHGELGSQHQREDKPNVNDRDW